MGLLSPLKPGVRRLLKSLWPRPKAVDLRAIWERDCQKWLIDGVIIEDGRLTIHGWCIAPGMADQLDFTWNGRPFTKVQYPLPRPDVGTFFEFLPGAANSGFVCDVTLAPGEHLTLSELKFDCVRRGTTQPLSEHFRPLWDFRPKAGYELPQTDRRSRVMGGSSELDFRMGGITGFHALEMALQQVFRKGFSDFPRVMDWGCGCGRVTRYFRERTANQVTGVDVDADNVRWCQTHLDFAKFETIPLYPPTQFATDSFDLIFGISVFTHLMEPTQFAWLDELQRIAKPGAVVLMSFHHHASMVYGRPTADQVAQLRRTGFLDLPNVKYDADLSEAGYYRDIWHTEAYIRKHWGERFEVCAILPHHLSHQDLVVMRRR